MESAESIEAGSGFTESEEFHNLELQELDLNESLHQMLLEVFEDGSGDEAFENVVPGNNSNGVESASLDTACDDWTWTEGSSQRNYTVEFSGKPGPNIALTPPYSPLDFLQQIISTDLLERIARETNGYAEQISNTRTSVQEMLTSWEPTNKNELWSFLGLLTAMKLVHVENFSLYWSTDILYSLPFFHSVMSSERFFLLFRFLHLSNNQDPKSQGNLLSKIMPFLEYILAKCQAVYQPRQHLALGEAVIVWNSNQTAQSEITSHGIKVYELVDTHNGFCCGFHVCEPHTESMCPGVPSSVVMKLIKPYFNKGYHLYLGTYCDSPALYQDLADNGVLACGPVVADQAGLGFSSVTELTKDGDFSVTHHNKINHVKVVKNGEKMDFLTTIHTDDFGDSSFPDSLFEDYNKYMNILDQYDLTTEDKALSKQYMKWWKKIFIQFFSLAQTNAYLLYCDFITRKGRHPISKKSFLRELSKQMALFCLPPRTPHDKQKSTVVSRTSDLNRLIERHFISRVRMDGENQPQEKKKKLKPRSCVVCHSAAQTKNHATKTPRRRATIYECRECDVGLCPLPCFKLYHTEKNYKQAYLQLDPRDLNVADGECHAV